MMREQLINDFLTKSGWGDAERAPVEGDASTRAYERLTLGSVKMGSVKMGSVKMGSVKMGGDKAVLMNAPFEASHAPYSNDPYTVTAKLAGSDPEAFICLATALTRRGFSAPRILAADMDNGLLLLEDLGADLFAQILAREPRKERALYSAAISCLAAIYRSSFAETLNAQGANWHIRTYDNKALQAEADLFLDWYIPEFDTALSPKAKQEWYDIWTEAFTHLDVHASGLALRDFHAENIFWLPERTATAQIGLIDFQDALFAHPSYDLVSLLEDARRDVDPYMVGDLISQFCSEAGIADDDKFRAAYAVMGAQRNAKILGIFVRLARRDGKQHYLDMIPRVAAHFRHDIEHPALAVLNAWISKYAPSILEDTL